MTNNAFGDSPIKYQYLTTEELKALWQLKLKELKEIKALLKLKSKGQNDNNKI